ncbi:hypothetical protein QYE76_031589 [Lolium multiflorum]|uniref:Transposase (putative) gypsy type domain-containing protein n=1 Tax=Lolium multiflorum TaxID=4521 RepID=A0AAD8QTH0_LOLMU|nr:hypothetical protein QYE76_031589 [Lolium multiflorum]
MPPRPKLTRHNTSESMAAQDLGNTKWERSKISPQDINLLKKLGLSKKKDALLFPSEESYPAPPIGYRVSFVDHLIRGLSAPIHEFLRGLLFVYGLQLHHLTPSSILHISIFITLCECFLGVQPSWALWKRIFFIRRNGSHNVTYNIGGVVICIRPDVKYFDVKFPDSVQGWRRRWLYVREDCSDLLEYNIAPFDGSAKILRRRSWDAEATEEEKTATEALMSRIHELQNTRGQELSGIQITAHFLKIRVQPLQARKNPLWMYAGDKDVDRMSTDLSVMDLEKLVRKISSLNKKDLVPSSCRVVPYSGTNALPQNHQTASSLPPLPEGGEVDERAIVADDTQVPSHPESGVVASQKSTARSGKEIQSEASESTESIPSAVSPKNKRKMGEVEDSGTSKRSSSPVEETVPEETQPFDAYASALVSSGEEEEEEPAANMTAPPFINLGAQFIGYRNTVEGLKECLLAADKRADDLAAKLKASEEAREKAEKDASCIEDLRKRLHEAETALSDKIAQNVAHEAKISARLESLNRRFVRKMSQDFVLEKPEDNRLLDTLSLLEIHADLVRRSIFNAKKAFSRLFPYFFPKKKEPGTFSALAESFVPNEDLGLALRQENLKIGVEGTIALVAESQQSVDWAKVGEATKMKQDKLPNLIRAAKPHSKKILAFLGYKPTPSSSSAKTKVK